jgi:hypothetical protein
VDEQDDVGPGVGSPDTDVVEPAAGAQADGSGVVDAVLADAVVSVGSCCGMPDLGSALTVRDYDQAITTSGLPVLKSGLLDAMSSSLYSHGHGSSVGRGTPQRGAPGAVVGRPHAGATRGGRGRSPANSRGNRGG